MEVFGSNPTLISILLLGAVIQTPTLGPYSSLAANCKWGFLAAFEEQGRKLNSALTSIYASE